ncbi:PilZ domain-containing protein [Celeribacter arenosi]|uniref:PilZ domain-containing protein n=1 Tax=Celeribacter arenosi TaxID=792649 RepID=A0ABP7KCK6_9RHOB
MLRVALLIGALCLPIVFSATPARAALSCDMEDWLVSLDQAANALTRALGTPDEARAAQVLRHSLSSFTNESVQREILASGFVDNGGALSNYVETRRRFLNLQAENWTHAAKDFASDPRFLRQSENLQFFLISAQCDIVRSSHLVRADPTATPTKRLMDGLRKVIEAPTTPPPERVTFDPDDFSNLRDANEIPGASPVGAFNIQPRQIALACGVFTFLASMTLWTWMRLSTSHRRSERHTCVLPASVAAGDTTHSCEILDISQLGAKLDWTHPLAPNSRLLLRVGALEMPCRVAWQNSHFMGVQFDRHISMSQLSDILNLNTVLSAAQKDAA